MKTLLFVMMESALPLPSPQLSLQSVSYNKCHDSEITSLITTESELECSGSETLTCEIESYATETVTYTSTEPVIVPITKNGETTDSTSYTTIYSEATFTYVTKVESTVIPPVESTEPSNADQQHSTIELTTVISTTSPAESSFTSTTSTSMETAISTLEDAGNKMEPSLIFSLGVLLSIIFCV
ncbi:unnamed protein product [[Candida] boidinii]|uniref:Unnamed protein product n=1 Tax=Candida boidinii TaxID=5477 RepID=A0ACB5TG49_CANBO|nr:unnamed protein product [[Candida] boidinii]